MEWKWVEIEFTLRAHARLLATFGGPEGILNLDSIQSALAAPKWQVHFANKENPPTHATLAASYLCGIVRNHGFADGNKRTALAVALVFLATNGAALHTGDDEIISVVQNVAAGDMVEEELIKWLEEHLIYASDYGLAC